MSGGNDQRRRAPRPTCTLSTASARLCTSIGSTDSNSSLAYLDASIRWPPSLNVLALGGTWLKKATFGLSGARDSASPISTAITTG